MENYMEFFRYGVVILVCALVFFWVRRVDSQKEVIRALLWMLLRRRESGGTFTFNAFERAMINKAREYAE